MPSILVIDDEHTMRESILVVLGDEGYRARGAATGAEAVAALERESWDLVITDLKLPDIDGIEILRRSRQISGRTPVLIITAYATMETAIEALRLGAVDYLVKPLNLDDLLHKIGRVLEHGRLRLENAWLRRQLSGSEIGFVGESKGAREVCRLIGLYGPMDRTVLVSGESGTGKELVARALHAASPRKDGPFVAVNCAAIPETLMESELFGHRKGAFTGADRDRQGYFQLATRGTLFLDEIADLPLGLQAKLLRALENKEIFPVGSDSPVAVHARVIAATNRQLETLVDEQHFRKDLFFRLNVLLIAVPALWERTEDIGPLVEHFIEKHREDLHTPVIGISPEAEAGLRRYRWPGNARELENVLQRAMILAQGEHLVPSDFPPEIISGPSPAPGPGSPLKDAVKDFERGVIQGAIERAGGDKAQAAKGLGISLASLYAKLKNGD